MTANTGVLELEQLTATVGVLVRGVDIERLRDDEQLPAEVTGALEQYGVLVFRDLHIDDETQVEFCKKLGEVHVIESKWTPGIYEISDNPDNPLKSYSRGSVNWHLDGLLDQTISTHYGVLTPKQLSDEGGDTQFASSYAAYDLLSDAERERLADLRVVYTMEASHRKVVSDPTEEDLAMWASRAPREHPLVWTHDDGRRSLVLSSTADYVVGMERHEGRALIDDLTARATTAERVYSHHWRLGDTVMWNNHGAYHRVTPYPAESGRRMHRTTILSSAAIS